MARDQGWSLSEKGFLRIGEDGEPLTGDAAELRTFATEAEAYAFLGLPFIEPGAARGRRRDRGGAGRPPARPHRAGRPARRPAQPLRLVRRPPPDRGHGRGRPAARLRLPGPDRPHPVARDRPRPDARTGSREQAEIIAALNARFAAEEAAGTAPPETPPEGFRLLHGCELEVRADGALDYEDDLLARFDLVVASVHVARRQSRAELTRRTLNAIRSPHVDVIAHPSGRKIGQRDDLDLDWDAVYAEAARTGTALEMNGSPHRLDLAVERARRAVAVGCLLSIDSDAHDIARARLRALGDQPGAPGVGQARRTSLNTRSRADLLAWVAGKPDGGRDRQPPYPIGRPMDDRSARRDLALVAVTVVGLSRLLEPPLVWLVGRRAARGDAPRHAPGPGRRGRSGATRWFGVPIESLILPAVAAVACLGAIRLVPFGLWLVPALAVTWLIVGADARARGAAHRDRRRR